ncbi:alpha/beta hydrolase family protein [Oleiharenicola lentus]|uniref:alpha/beta hydrolase family protein n=1 Tax=Oleiharenicola lentus TaxID=2508720 RepID=UPI003F6671A8
MNRFVIFLASATALVAQTPTTPATAPFATTPTTTPPTTVQIEQVLSVPEPGRFKALFQPFRTDIAALSPDGKHLAYTVRDGENLNVVIIEIDNPSKMKAYVGVMNDEAATPMLEINQRERTPARINWMKWATATRLLVETNQIFTRNEGGAAGQWQGWRGGIVAFNVDGSDAKTLVTPFDLQEVTPAISGQSNPFAISRAADAAKFSAKVGTPDRPATEDPDAEPSDGFSPVAGSEDPFAPPGSPTNFTTRGRTLRTFDFDPKNPGAITIVASGSGSPQWLGLYSLNIATGKLAVINDDIAPLNSDALIDRQGRIRLSLPNTKLSDFPFHYNYYGPKGKNRGKRFDEIATLSTKSAFTVSPENFFGERAIPLGFDENPDILYYASNVGRDTYGIYSLNLATKENRKFALENPRFDLIAPPESSFPDSRTLVFDRFQHNLAGVRFEGAVRSAVWLRPELQQLQVDLEKKFAGRSMEIVDWDATSNRFLFTTQGPADPGAYFVYDRAKGQLMEFVRRAPWLDANHAHVTLPFSFNTKEGARITGLVTAPSKPRLKPIPMLILCPDLPWQRVRSGYQGDVQALADMGFVVVQLNGRGAWGFGLKQRQTLTTGYDLVQVEDIVETIANLEKLFPVNPRRVAVMGRGHGGFIALRAVQMYPDKFRCAVAIDAPVDLGGWLEEQRWSSDNIEATLRKAWFGDAARLKAKPLVSAPEAVKKPILLLNYPGPEGESRTGAYARARQFAASVRRNDVVAEFADLRSDYVRGLPDARGEVFERIEAFLNQYVYTPNVKLGDTIFKDEVKAP